MIYHSLAALCRCDRIDQVWVILSPGDEWWGGYDWSALQPKLQVLFCGGATRAESVANGLSALADIVSDQDWMLVHDAARCLVTSLQIETLIAECQHDSVGGLLAHKIPDTLKTAVTGPGGVRVVGTLERSDKWLAQTPQMFRLEPLLHALEKLGDAATDEASAMEAAGHRPKLVAGGAQNFKVTYPEDFALASAVLAYREGSSTTARFGELAPAKPERGNRFF